MKHEDKEALVKYRMSKATDTLDEINVLIENDLLGTAVNRLYYGCFYAVTALLIQHDISTKTHNGARQMFGLHFVKPGIVSKESNDFYSEIFDLRQTGDYEDFFVFEKDKVLSLLPQAQRLLQEIEQILAKE